LGTGVRAGGVKSCSKPLNILVSERISGLEHTDKLVPKKVLAGLDTTGDSEGNFACVVNQLVDGPDASGGVVAVLVDLEPFKASDILLSCVRNLRAKFS
jgi:hypothetical protein